MGKFSNFIKSKFFWGNIAAVIVIAITLISIVLYSLKSFTSHGVEMEVPSLKGMNISEAELILNANHLAVVIVDSVYVKNVGFGEIVEQTPIAYSKIKKGRKIYVTVNSSSKKKMPLPNVSNSSFRQALSTLKSISLNVEVEYRPSEYDQLVLEVLNSNMEPITPGTLIAEGSNVILIVGKAYKEGSVTMPNLKGLTREEAIQKIKDLDLYLGNEFFNDELTNNDSKNECFVYKQEPKASISVEYGKRVDIWLSKDKTKEDSYSSEEDFF